MYVPNLGPLVDAHFACDDEWESDLIVDLMDSFKNGSPWPRKVYAEGLKESGLSEYTYKALGQVCDDYYDNMAGGIDRRKKLEFPSPPQSPPTTDVGPLLASARAAKQVQEAVDVGKAEGGGEIAAHSKGRGKGKRKGKKQHRKPRFVIKNPPPIVCAVRAPFEWPDYPGGPPLKGNGSGKLKEKVGASTSRKGEEKVGGSGFGKGKEKVSESGSGEERYGEESDDEEVPRKDPRDPSVAEIVSCFVTSDSENLSDKSYDLYLEESGSDYDWSVVRIRRRWVPNASL